MGCYTNNLFVIFYKQIIIFHSYWFYTYNTKICKFWDKLSQYDIDNISKNPTPTRTLQTCNSPVDFCQWHKNPISFVLKDPQAYLVFCGKHLILWFQMNLLGHWKNKNEKIKQIAALTFLALDDGLEIEEGIVIGPT